MISKLKRTLTAILPVDEGREGSCNACGECCKLPTRCTFLKTDAEGKYSCSVYRFRPLNCRKFPRSRAQLAPVMEHCGYSFKEKAG